MGELVFVGLGLNNALGVSLEGLEEAISADAVYIELYSSPMPKFSLGKLQELVGKRIAVLTRKNLEDEAGRQVIEDARRKKVVLFTPGDPMIATTHMALRIRAAKAGIKTRIVHGASIASAAPGLAGLQNYKFGRAVTVAYPELGYMPETAYDVIKENKRLGLHTLVFLGVRADKRYMTIKEALEFIRTIEERRQEGIIVEDTLAIGIARAGAKRPIVKAGSVCELMRYKFGEPPHILIVPGELHFMEAEALVVLAEAPKEILKGEQID